MFFKNSEDSTSRTAPAGGTRNAIPSLLSDGVRVRGEITSSGEIQVDGELEGDVIAHSLVVSETGVVNGTVAAQSVRILGTVTGTITAGSIKLARTARVTGDIIHEALSIEEGAFVLGHCRRAEPEEQDAGSDEPLGGGVAAATDRPPAFAIPSLAAEDSIAAAASENALTIPPGAD